MSFYFIIQTSRRFSDFYLCFWFLALFFYLDMWSVDNFLSYGRILTLYY